MSGIENTYMTWKGKDSTAKAMEGVEGKGKQTIMPLCLNYSILDTKSSLHWFLFFDTW